VACLGGTAEDYMLNLAITGMPILSQHACDQQIAPKSLLSPGSLLYKCLSMESTSQTFASPLREVATDDPVESSELEEEVEVTLKIPGAVWSGCSERSNLSSIFTILPE
jgi:hypothetical protein